MKNIILGKNLTVPADVPYRNENILISGPTSSGKTRYLIKPNILENLDCSYVIMDPKGRLLSEMGSALKDAGYRIQNIDLSGDGSSFRYNPLLQIRRQSDIDALAEVLSKSVKSERQPYFSVMAGFLLSAVIGYVVTQLPEEERTFASVARLLSLKEPKNKMGFRNTVSSSKLDKYFEALEINRRAAEDLLESGEQNEAAMMVVKMMENYDAVKKNADITSRAVNSTARSAMRPFTTAVARKTTCYGNDIDIPSIGRTKTALFLTVPESDTANHPLASLIIQQLIQGLFREADSMPDGRLSMPVSFILDDFFALVPIKDFPEILSTSRSRNISFTIVLQHESQLRERYGKAADSVVSNCSINVFLGCNDVRTAKSVAARVNRPVYEVLTLPRDLQWVFVQGELPQCVEKYDVTEHPLYRTLHEYEGDGKEFDIQSNLTALREALV